MKLLPHHTSLRWLVTLGCLAALSSGVRAADASAQWAEIVERGRAAGVDAAALQPIVQGCRERGMTPAETQAAVAPAFQVAQAKLPARLVLEKVTEGVTKQVSADVLVPAALRRAEVVQSGHVLLHDTLGEPDCQHDELLAAIVHGLESGLPVPLLREVLPLCRTMGSNRLSTLLQAGEMLQLGGVPGSDIRRLLLDFQQRNLGRGQMMRAVEIALRTKTQPSVSTH